MNTQFYSDKPVQFSSFRGLSDAGNEEETTVGTFLKWLEGVTCPLNISCSLAKQAPKAATTAKDVYDGGVKIADIPAQVNQTTRNIAIIAGVGVAAYLLFLTAPAVRGAAKRKARSYNE